MTKNVPLEETTLTPRTDAVATHLNLSHGDMRDAARSLLNLARQLEGELFAMRKNYPPQHANADGWTDWISPTDIDMYGMQCCDCGLKHEMQFRVLRNKAYTDGVNWFADPVPAEEGYHVAFRMRR